MAGHAVRVPESASWVMILDALGELSGFLPDWSAVRMVGTVAIGFEAGTHCVALSPLIGWLLPAGTGIGDRFRPWPTAGLQGSKVVGASAQRGEGNSPNVLFRPPIRRFPSWRSPRPDQAAFAIRRTARGAARPACQVSDTKPEPSIVRAREAAPEWITLV